jgi:hypothetical protein
MQCSGTFLVNKTEDEEDEERDQHKVPVVVVCQVINRDLPHTQKPMYVQVLINLTNETKCDVDITKFKRRG